MRRIFIILIMLFFIISCSTITTQLVDPMGRVLPDPHYTLHVIGQPMIVTFYYSTFEERRDVDGSLIGKPKFLDMMNHHDIYEEKYKSVFLTIEIRNPEKVEYSLHDQIKWKTKNKSMMIGGKVNHSNLEYRQYMYELPFGNGIKEVDHSMVLKINDQEILRIGNFRYNIIYERG